MLSSVSSLCPSLFIFFSITPLLSFPLGQISLAEFMEGAQKDEWLMDMLKLDFNASGWVIQNRTKTLWYKDMFHLWDSVLHVDGFLSGDGCLPPNTQVYFQGQSMYGGLNETAPGNWPQLKHVTFSLWWWMWHKLDRSKGGVKRACYWAICQHKTTPARSVPCDMCDASAIMQLYHFNSLYQNAICILNTVQVDVQDTVLHYSAYWTLPCPFLFGGLNQRRNEKMFC